MDGSSVVAIGPIRVRVSDPLEVLSARELHTSACGADVPNRADESPESAE